MRASLGIVDAKQDVSGGLFVAAKTPAGFVVRESQSGRTTVSFDYRVVATALGQTGQRMATTTAAPARIPVPVFSKIIRPSTPPAFPQQ